MYKIEVLTMSDVWEDCQVFAVWNASTKEHVTPEFESIQAAQAHIDSNTMVAGWQRDGAIRIVPAIKHCKSDSGLVDEDGNQAYIRHLENSAAGEEARREMEWQDAAGYT